MSTWMNDFKQPLSIVNHQTVTVCAFMGLNVLGVNKILFKIVAKLRFSTVSIKVRSDIMNHNVDRCMLTDPNRRMDKVG